MGSLLYCSRKRVADSFMLDHGTCKTGLILYMAFSWVLTNSISDRREKSFTRVWTAPSSAAMTTLRRNVNVARNSFFKRGLFLCAAGFANSRFSFSWHSSSSFVSLSITAACLQDTDNCDQSDFLNEQQSITRITLPQACIVLVQRLLKIYMPTYKKIYSTTC